MALAVAIADAVKTTNQYQPDGLDRIMSSRHTRFIYPDAADNSSFARPQAVLVETDPSYVIPAHFHSTDQFQIFTSGGGNIGRHSCDPISIHYTDGFTPYGPIRAGVEGLGWYTLRNRGEVGAYWMPGQKAQLERAPRRALVAHSPLRFGVEGTSETEVIHDVPLADDGLLASSYRLAPGDKIEGPDPRTGAGQYYIVVNGEWVRDKVSLASGSIVYVEPTDDVQILTATSAALDVLVYQFPKAT
jgi:hypothetical protein